MSLSRDGWSRRGPGWKAATSSSTTSMKSGASKSHRDSIPAGRTRQASRFHRSCFRSTGSSTRTAEVEFTGAFYKGQNVAHAGQRNPTGLYTLTTGRPDAVDSIGGWGQFTVHAAPRIDLHLFTGQQDDQDRELSAGRIGKNLLYGGNLYYRLAPNVILGLEATQLRTKYIGQGFRINNHYDLALAYHF